MIGIKDTGQIELKGLQNKLLDVFFAGILAFDLKCAFRHMHILLPWRMPMLMQNGSLFCLSDWIKKKMLQAATSFIAS